MFANRYRYLSDAATAANQRRAWGRHKSTSAPICNARQMTSHVLRLAIDSSDDAAFARPERATTKIATMANRTQPAPLNVTYARKVHSTMKKTWPPLLTTCSGQMIQTISSTTADADIAAVATEITRGRAGSRSPTSLTAVFVFKVLILRDPNPTFGLKPTR